MCSWINVTARTLRVCALCNAVIGISTVQQIGTAVFGISTVQQIGTAVFGISTVQQIGTAVTGISTVQQIGTAVIGISTVQQIGIAVTCSINGCRVNSESEWTKEDKFHSTSLIMYTHMHVCAWLLNNLRYYVVLTPTNALFSNLVKSFKFTLKCTIVSLLHVSFINDHHQGALSVPN